MKTPSLFVPSLDSASLIAEIDSLPIPEKIVALNDLRKKLHAISPFKNEPVDFVEWVVSDTVAANDYNPNSVAPPEMKLLEKSIEADGYTQPIVTFGQNGAREVVDGFHRNRVGKESKKVSRRVLGHLPVVTINADREDKADRISATIRHNRARGKHRVEGMSDIVIELKRRNWSDERISENLGMDMDEILRLCQITGLAELFSDQEFSKSWDVEGEINEADFKELSDDVSTYGPESSEFRTVNTSDENRIFHTHDKWECHKAGFYDNFKTGMTKEECEKAYCDFLSNIPKFKKALKAVISEWKHSCEHYLTNSAMNRIAWLGQAAACYAIKVPSSFRSGFYLLTPEQQKQADETALKFLNKWLKTNKLETVSMEEALSHDRQSDIY